MLLEMWSKVGLGERGMERRKGENMELTLPIQVDRTWNKKGTTAAAG